MHAQTYGWLSWAWNGDSAGTSGLGKRLEAIQIVLVKKGRRCFNGSKWNQEQSGFCHILLRMIVSGKAVVDEPAHETPIYEEQDVYENHSTWPDGTICDELGDSGAK